MKTVAIVQARMSSTRLPGKVLKPLVGRVVLEHVLSRLTQCKNIDEVVVATTTDKIDDQLVAWCKHHNQTCFRGDRDDVLLRYYRCATKYNADEVVRITSDNPLLDPDIVDQVIELRNHKKADYAANNIKKTYPHGLDVEIITYKALRESNEEAVELFEREHVTQYVRHRPEKYILANLGVSGDWHDIRVTLDEDEDKQLIELVMRILGEDLRFVDLKKLFTEFPALKNMNTNSMERHAKYNSNENIV